MKPILLKNNKIEIPFQDADGNVVLTLWFDKGDEPLKKLEKEFEKIKETQKELEIVGDDDFEASFDKSKESIKQAADVLFGIGSFEKLYDLNPSISIVADYVYQIAIGIKEELESETLKDVENKYLK